MHLGRSLLHVDARITTLVSKTNRPWRCPWLCAMKRSFTAWFTADSANNSLLIFLWVINFFFAERMLALSKMTNSACKPLESLCLARSSFMAGVRQRAWSEQLIGQNFNTLEKSTAASFAGSFFAAVAYLARLDGCAPVAEAP